MLKEKNSKVIKNELPISNYKTLDSPPCTLTPTCRTGR
jgi:hypothetical protein